MVEIAVNQQQKERLRYTFDRGIITIGRSASNEIYLLSPVVADRHARISLFDDICVIQRLDPEGGVFVNGREIDRARLYDHDVILIGPFKLSILGEKLARPSYDPAPGPIEADPTTREAQPENGVDDTAPRIDGTFTPFTEGERTHGDTDGRMPAPTETANGPAESASPPSASGEPVASLLSTGVDVLSGPAKGRRILFTGKTARLGIKDETVVTIAPSGHGYVVTATNRYIVATHNGERLTDKPEPLSHGDLIEFSELKARFFVNRD